MAVVLLQRTTHGHPSVSWCPLSTRPATSQPAVTNSACASFGGPAGSRGGSVPLAFRGLGARPSALPWNDRLALDQVIAARDAPPPGLVAAVPLDRLDEPLFEGAPRCPAEPLPDRLLPDR